MRNRRSEPKLPHWRCGANGAIFFREYCNKQDPLLCVTRPGGSCEARRRRDWNGTGALSETDLGRMN